MKMKLIRKKTMATLLIAVFILSMLTVALPVSAQVGPTEVWVDASFVDQPSVDIYNALQTPVTNLIYDTDAFPTITRGIAGVDEEGIVNVAEGTYNEFLTIDKSLTLRGDIGDPDIAGVGPKAPVLDGELVVGSAITIAGGVSYVTIEGFEICNYRNKNLVDPWITGGTGSAILAWGSTAISYVTVRNNYMHDIGWNAVLVGNEGQALHSDWLVENNLIAEFWAYGIELTNTKNSEIIGNHVTGGTDILGELDGGSINGILVQTTGPTVSNVLVTDNIVVGPFEYAGIELLAYLSSNELDVITVTNNEVSGALIGIRVRSRGTAAHIQGLTVTGNELSGNVAGIQFNDYEGTGIFDYSSIHVNYNNIVGNDLGIENLGIGTLDATLNWWGHASGPSGEYGRVNKAGKVIGKGDAVSANVDWDQWLPQPVFHTPHHPVPPGLDR